MAPLHEQTSEIWDRVHATNIKGAFLGMKYGIISMLKSGGGSIVNTTSASGVVGWKHHSVYGAAKAGVNSLTRAAALDYSDKNIRVNAIAPGTMWTGLVGASQQFAEPPADFPTLAGIPLGPQGLHAYFVHSYQLNADNSGDVIARAEYGGPITAMVRRDNIVGTQFHPEKSQKLGLALIANFLKWAP